MVNMKSQTMSPIVSAYINTNEMLSVILQKHCKKEQVLEQTLLILNHSVYSEVINEQIFDQIDQALLIGHPDPNVFILFLATAITLTSGRDRFENANVLHSIGNSLPRNNIYPVLWGNFLISGARLKNAENKIQECGALLDNALKIIDKNSPRFNTMVINIGIIKASQGRLKELSNDILAIFENPINENHAWLSDEINLVNSLMIGDFANGFEFLKLWEKKCPKGMDLSKQYRLNMLKILSGDFSEKNYQEDFFKIYVNICKSITMSKWEEALQYFQHYKSYIRPDFPQMPFELYLPLHLHLCLRNTEDAKAIFQEKVNLNQLNYLDDFFFARIQLLELNVSGAQETFSRLIENVNRFGAINRLHFELQFAKELSTSDLLTLLNINQGVFNKKKLEEKLLPVKPNKSLDKILGVSKGILGVKNLIKQFSLLNETILITGETGTGKELVARAIHEEGSFSKEPFIAINCGALTDALLQSELFGYVAGAFTGAQKEHRGIFEAAKNGTVFLDEFGDISPKMQVSLLRVLESKEIRKIGSNNNLQIKCKILVATNVDLQKSVQENKFRADLYYRLIRFEIKLPPLRNRLEDLPLLINYFLSSSNDFSHQNKKNLTSELLRILLTYQWPGNIRELKNEMDRLKLLTPEKDIIDIHDFDFNHLQNFDPNLTFSAHAFNREEKSILSNDRVLSIINRGDKVSTRLENLKDLFRKHKRLTRKQVVEIFSISSVTATKDLEALCQMGFIHQNMPTKSMRSRYFSLKENV